MYDVVVFGSTESTPSHQKSAVIPFAEAGATWWLEDISPLRLGWGWGDVWKEWDVQPLRDRIKAGPPRID